jgi:hypothetical protein
MMNASRKARMRVVAPIAIAAVGLTAACTHHRPRPHPTTTLVAPPSTDAHGHTDQDHANLTTTTVATTEHGAHDH